MIPRRMAESTVFSMASPFRDFLRKNIWLSGPGWLILCGKGALAWPLGSNRVCPSIAQTHPISKGARHVRPPTAKESWQLDDLAGTRPKWRQAGVDPAAILEGNGRGHRGCDRRASFWPG